MRYRQVKGMPVVTMVERKQVGTVDELVVDADRKQVRWLRLHKGRWFGERRWLPVEKIKALDQATVEILAEEDVQKPGQAAEAEALVETRRALIGAIVMTEAGEELGIIRDYEFSPFTFRLTRFHVDPGVNFLSAPLIIPAERLQATSS